MANVDKTSDINLPVDISINRSLAKLARSFTINEIPCYIVNEYVITFDVVAPHASILHPVS